MRESLAKIKLWFLRFTNSPGKLTLALFLLIGLFVLIKEGPRQIKKKAMAEKANALKIKYPSIQKFVDHYLDGQDWKVKSEQYKEDDKIIEVWVIVDYHGMAMNALFYLESDSGLIRYDKFIREVEEYTLFNDVFFNRQGIIKEVIGSENFED